MELIAQINGAVNGFVWGAPMLVLLIGVGILMTVRNRGLQFRKFGYAMKNTIGKIFHKTHAGEGEITPFQAVSTALAGTVGTGNIAGITTAVTLGGPGTLFWLWVTALHWHGHQVFRGALGGQVPGAEQVRGLGGRPHVLY